MHRKLEYRVGATRAAWLSLPALFAHAWNGVLGVSTSLKPPMAAGGTDNDELFGNQGSRIELESCLTPFVLGKGDRLYGGAGDDTLPDCKAWRAAA